MGIVPHQSLRYSQRARQLPSCCTAALTRRRKSGAATASSSTTRTYLRHHQQMRRPSQQRSMLLLSWQRSTAQVYQLSVSPQHAGGQQEHGSSAAPRCSWLWDGTSVQPKAMHMSMAPHRAAAAWRCRASP